MFTLAVLVFHLPRKVPKCLTLHACQRLLELTATQRDTELVAFYFHVNQPHSIPVRFRRQSHSETQLSAGVAHQPAVYTIDISIILNALCLGFLKITKAYI